MPNDSCLINYLTLISYLVNSIWLCLLCLFSGSKSVLFQSYFLAKNSRIYREFLAKNFLDDKLKSFPQLISNEVSDCVPNFSWLRPKVSWLWDLLFWESTKFFSPHRDFLLKSTFIGMLHVYLFKALKIIDLFMCVLNFLFRDCLYSLSLKFKVRPILSFSRMMSFMSIFIFNYSHN